MIEWIYILIGAFISWLIIRLIDGIIREGMIVMGIFFLVELWHYWLHPLIGFPNLPMWVYKLMAGVALAWGIYRFWILFVSYTKRGSIFRKISKVIFGKVEKLTF